MPNYAVLQGNDRVVLVHEDEYEEMNRDPSAFYVNAPDAEFLGTVTIAEHKGLRAFHALPSVMEET